jgi:hypothetical protein
MNEQIEKILVELDIDLYTDKGVMMTQILVRPKDLRQFAELIVKECMSLVSEPGPDMNDTERGILAQIKEHFGVEE